MCTKKSFLALVLMASSIGASGGCGQQSSERSRLPSLIDDASNPIPKPLAAGRSGSASGERIATTN